MKTLVAVLILAALGGGGWYWYAVHNAAPPFTFRTAEITRGEMVPTISATGTVEPLDSIDVGAQVAGQIISFGTDTRGKLVDYRSPVEEGKILATIDETLYDADLTSAKANLEASIAAVDSAEATLAQYEAQRANTLSVWERAQSLFPTEAISKNDYEAAKAAFNVADANVRLGKAVIKQANANVSQSKAMLSKAQKNVDYCIIRAPVTGVIIDRRVNVGQTVVSSLNAPSLFLIAKDLKKVQVWVSVNEADIDKVQPGQAVSFTVDAFPGETFTGTVGKVRLNAQMTQNVVTYTVEVNTENSDERLFPYMTANVQFEIARHKDALLVPNAALRWYPQPEMVAPNVRKAVAEKAKPALDPQEVAEQAQRRKRPRGSTTQPATRPVNTGPHGHGILWVSDGKYLHPVRVRTGYTDGVNTEITFRDKETELPDGAQIVIGEQRAQSADSATNNPFAPQPWGKRH